MSDADEPKSGITARLRKWFMTKVVSDVPEDLAACEFSCRRTECAHGEWESCPRRLAGGLLMDRGESPDPAARGEAAGSSPGPQGELFPDDDDLSTAGVGPEP